MKPKLTDKNDLTTIVDTQTESRRKMLSAVERARFTCAHYAETADELRLFLDALGI